MASFAAVYELDKNKAQKYYDRTMTAPKESE